jgi:cell division protein FtsI/penicillin-binding protein 2
LLSHIIDGSDADNLGIAGIEKVFDSAGIQYAVRDGLQKSINECNAVGGAAVVMNISNGEIISLVSLPYFDNSLFTSKFWESFQKAMGTHLSFSTAFHPQSQGQVERVRCYFEARVWKRIVALSFLSLH